MTYVNLAPTSTTANSGAVTGAGSAHAALSDASDSSYVTYNAAEGSILGMTDLTLPSGALLILAQVFARCKRSGGPASLKSSIVAGSQTNEVNTTVNWTTTTEVGGSAIAYTLTDADVDGAVCGISNTSILGDLVAYEMYLRVLYLVKPTVTVDAPTGTVTSNVVTVEWSPTFDPQAYSDPSFYDLRIFTAAQYGIGGFNPETSPATVSVSDQQSAGGNYRIIDQYLLDGNYRAYVRVAAGNTPTHKSDWAYGAFTVDAPNPGVPTIAATAAPSSGAISVYLDDNTGDVSTTSFVLQRSDDGGTTFVDVRTSNGDGVVTPTGGNATVLDYEAPNGTAVTYRARAYNAATPSYSDWASDTETWSSDDVWLKNATNPSLNIRAILRSYASTAKASNQGTFRPLGSSEAIVVSDVRGPETGSITIMTESLDDRTALEASLDAQSPMLIQVPVSNEQPQRWVVFGDTSSERLFDKAWIPYHDETLPWTRVSRPTGPIEE